MAFSRSNGMVSTSEQLSQLEFCSAVLKEALRLRTPAPLLAFNCTVGVARVLCQEERLTSLSKLRAFVREASSATCHFTPYVVTPMNSSVNRALHVA